MARKRRVSEIVEAARECQRLNDEGSSWGYKLFAGMASQVSCKSSGWVNMTRRC